MNKQHDFALWRMHLEVRKNFRSRAAMVGLKFLAQLTSHADACGRFDLGKNFERRDKAVRRFKETNRIFRIFDLI